MWDTFRQALHKVITEQVRDDFGISGEDEMVLVDGWELLVAHIIRQIRDGFHLTKLLIQ